MTDKIFAHKRIGILGKGGSGKSTITVVLSKALRNVGYQVCVLDADSTNAGIHAALGFEQPPVSLIDYFGGPVFSGGKVSCPVDDPTALPEAVVDLKKIPERFYASDGNGLFLFQLGKIADKGPGAGCDGPISKITRDLNIQGIGDQPVTVIDVKAGLEDSARGVVTSMDWIMTVVDPTVASIQIAADIKTLISQIQAGKVPPTEYLERPELIERVKQLYKEARIKTSFALLNKIRDKHTEDYVSKKLQEKGLTPIGVIHEDASISLSWLEGKPLEGTRANREMTAAIKKLEQMVHEL